jgi:pimeloyl-ACP methyl ester carboxylesterase
MVLTTTPYTDEVLSIAGTQLHLLKGGSGRPALVLHGIEGPEGWLQLHDLLSQQATVYAPSHPGYGLSERPEWLESVTHMAYFYERFLRESRLEDVDLIGFGLGGWVAAEMAAMCSHNLAHLVLVDSAGIRPQSGEILDIFIRPWAEVVSSCVTDPEGAEEFRRIYDAEPIQAFGGRREAGRVTAMRMAYRPYMHSPALPALLQGITTPTLVVHGAEDRIVPLECGEAFASAMPNAKLRILDGCGHWPHLERPDALAETILNFTRA